MTALDREHNHLRLVGEAIAGLQPHSGTLQRWGHDLAMHLRDGGRLLIAGNGGSAAAAQHLAAELVGKMCDDRQPLSAIALSADSATVTAISNDFGYEQVFARQVRAHGRPGDVLLVLSTSGRSPNLTMAVTAARQIGMRTWALVGPHPGTVDHGCDERLHCPGPNSQIVQELHLAVVHMICEHLDRTLRGGDTPSHQGISAVSPAGDQMVTAPPLVVVVGDSMLDRDIDGSANRVSQHEPALILTEHTSSARPGGAGLAALMAAGRGYQIALITTIADDPSGQHLRDLLSTAGIRVHELPSAGTTAEKIRLRDHGRTLLRLDRSTTTTDPDAPLPADAAEALTHASAILVSDYGRGTAAHPNLRRLLAEASAPIIWDPHPRGAPPVGGVHLVTPNLAEALTCAGLPSADPQRPLPAACAAGDQLQRRWNARAVVVTMGAHGAVLIDGRTTPLAIGVSAPVAGDTCGAGDQFAATATIALADGRITSEAVQQAVTDATRYLTRQARGPAPDQQPARDGTDPIGLAATVRAEGGTVVATGGCFDLLHAGHVATLQAARRLGDCLIVCLNSDASVRRLKGPSRPLIPQDDRHSLLAALSCVDAVVVFDEATPDAILADLKPHLWVKGGDYSELPEAGLLNRWGGQAVTVPYLAERSTSHLIAAARQSRHDELGEPTATPADAHGTATDLPLTASTEGARCHTAER